MEATQSSSFCNLDIFNSVSEDSVLEILERWNCICVSTQLLLNGSGDLSIGSEFASHIHFLCRHGLELLIEDYFLHSLEVSYLFRRGSLIVHYN